MAMPTESEQLATLQRALAEAGDDAPPDVLLVLWFLRHFMAVDELDAYQYVTWEEGRRIDGLFLERAFDASEAPTLYVFEAKVPVQVTPVTPAIVEGLAEVASAIRGGTFDPIGSADLRLLNLRENVGVESIENVAVRPVLLAASPLTPRARTRASELEVTIYDLDFLANLAHALSEPGLRQTVERVPCDADRRFVTETGTGTLVVAEVRASDIAAWGGIDDRSIFGLNIRGDLGPTRLRKDLERAIQTPEDRANFLAYHNGITVLCGEIIPDAAGLEIRNLSVVNGAQSLLAFRNHQAALTDDMRVLVKFVLATGDPTFATEVARRSNAQSAVNTRNLRANDGRQRALSFQFAQDFPDYAYVTKPDVTGPPLGEPIKNDDAAQLLCALFNERPWLAVKRVELFRDPNYRLIFNASTTAAHIVFAHRVRQRIDDWRASFPEDYRRSWRLTALMATYLVGQFMRPDPELRSWIRDPSAVAAGDGDTDLKLDEVSQVVATVMSEWHVQRVTDFGFDDFKVDFKRENTARSLARLVAKRALVT